ncbi:MAG: glycosyltransferase family 2 protein [Methylococcales bacterium]|nr:glycosyltransferase family 2 protein [Methylococcales bacterium]
MHFDQNPLITIIIAVFNGAKTLQQCIDSVAEQTYLNKQLIIIDGGSNDGTIELLKANDHRIGYWISEPDKGIYNAWNKGLLKAEGDWICFLGADDYFWDHNVLEKMSLQLEKLPIDINVVYGQIMLIGSNDEELYLSGESWDKVKQRFKQLMSIPHPGTMHSRRLFEKHGGFDESFQIAGDYELLLRELKISDAEFIPNLITVGMLQGGISSSFQNALVQLQEVRRAQLKHNLGLPSIRWIMAIFRVYIRMILWQVLGEKNTRRFLDFGRSIMGLPPHWTRTE